MAKIVQAKPKDTTRSRSSPRTPSQGRGVARYAALLDSVDALLTEFSPDDVGLYQIAEHARAAPASVYHFFPTKEAAFLALAQRYLEGFSELARQPVHPSALESWQTLSAWDQRLAMDFYNRHPPALKLFLGGFGGIETRQANIAYNVKIAALTYLRQDSAFHMPFVRDATKKFHVVIEMLDAIWAISYMHNGCVTDEYLREALDATTAYCRLFLPERVELRDEHRAAIAKGEPIYLYPVKGSGEADPAEG